MSAVLTCLRAVNVVACGAVLKKIGAYVVEKTLGQGGVATVYLGHKVDTTDNVVIKVGKAEDAADFMKEATLLRRLRHPNVVRVMDAGEEKGRVFIVMEHVSGVDAHVLLTQSRKSKAPLSHALSVLIARDVARALAAAHSLSDDAGKSYKVVHRDVTPTNVLLSSRGEVKLADFGTAKWDRAEVRTATGVIRGKYEYLSPEQARGDGVDARTDIFALGLVLYEAAVGRIAYEVADAYELIEAAISCAFRPLDADFRSSAPDVATMLDRLLARNPADRPQTAAEAAVALDVILHGEDEAALRRELSLRVQAAHPTTKRVPRHLSD